jgi:hypothetical protein
MFNVQFSFVIGGCAFGAVFRKKVREAPPQMTTF